MKIENINIKSFGKLSDLSIDLLDGINLIEGENESGKSTVCTFIKFIFFGLSNKAEKGAISERAKYLSWDERECSGSLTLEYNGKRYRVNRTLTLSSRGTPSEEVQIVDLDNNSVISGADPADTFIGVPEEVFVRSCFVSQTDSGKVGGADIREAIENILFSADETTNTKKALKKIDDARVELLHKNKKAGLIYDLHNRAESLYLRLGDARQAANDIAEKKKQSEENRRTIEEKEAIGEKYKKLLRHTDALRRLAAIDRTKEAEKKMLASDAAVREFERDNSCRGYIPDRAFCAATASAASEYRFVRDELEKTDESINEAEKEREAINKKTLCDPSLIITKLNSLTSQKRRNTVLAFIFILLCALFAAGALILYKKILIAAAALGVIAIASLVLGIVFAAKNSSVKNKRMDLLHSLSCSCEKELPKRLQDISSERSRLYELDGTIKVLTEKKASLSAKKEGIFDACSRLLEKWGRECLSEDDMAAASLAASSVADDYSSLKSSAAAAAAAYEQVKIDYTEEEENALRALVCTDGIENELSPDEYSEAVRQSDFAQRTAAMLRDRARETECALADMTARAESPEELESELTQVREEEKKHLAKYEALMLAYEKLAESSEALRERISPTLSKSASRFMGSATDGKYSTIGVDSSLELEYTSEDSINRDVAYMSAGTKDLAYLSLRLALADMLLSEKKPPIVMDESFVRQDEKRLCASLNSVAAFCDEGYQVLMLTSQGRDAKALKKIRKFNHIKL